MFAKPYKLKSATTLKNSEKKHLAQRIQDEFKGATDEKVKELVPVKSTTSCLKLVLHSGELVAVYSVDGVPIIIETEAGLVPTVCALWKVPDLVPSFAIHSPVLPKILGGAPLYLPGVVIPPGGVGFPMFTRGSIVAAHTTDNCAAGVVGRATMGSSDMIYRTAGVCLDTIQVFGDQLCREAKFNKIERPKFSPASYGDADSPEQLANSVSEMTIQPIREEWPALGRVQTVQKPPAAPETTPKAPERTPGPPEMPPSAPEVPPAAANEPRLIPDGPEHSDTTLNDSLNSDTIEVDEDEIPSDMDGLLRWSLLCWLRLDGKHVELPLKTSLLYRNHLFPLCPPERSLDVKKSTYKKMGKFLEAMQREGLLQVKEVEKGVDAVVSVNIAHPSVRALRVPAIVRARRDEANTHETDKDKEDYTPPTVREMLCVTAAVVELFAPVKKGTALSPGEVRSALTQYVKARGLDSQSQKGTVVLDPLLAKITGKQEQECVKWDMLMSSVSGRMTAATELRWADGHVALSKARLEPITMQVATRSGNKKVTLVNNLEAYGFTLGALSTACQRAVGASCGVTRSPGAKADQLMLQGDQTHFMAKLLIEKYGLPKKFVDGADKALNKKK